MNALFKTKQMTVEEISNSPITYIMFRNRWESAPIHSKINTMIMYYLPHSEVFWVYPLDLKEDIKTLWNDIQIYLDNPHDGMGDELKTLSKMQEFNDTLKKLGE